MKVTIFTVAYYAALTKENLLIISGVFDNLKVTPKPDVPLEEVANSAITLPRAYLVLSLEASVSEGLVHPLTLHLVNDDEEQLIEPAPFTINFQLNPYGRPMRHNQIIELAGLVFPKVSDYKFEIRRQGTRELIAESGFYITLNT